MYHGVGGNNLALQLVMDGLKLQPANPTMIDARDAILLADQINNDSRNHRAIWTAFAERVGAACHIGRTSQQFRCHRGFYRSDFPNAFDFGDAPDAQQSGFAASYPVLLADDGAASDRNLFGKQCRCGGRW
ncbi:MAG: M36 family metallopeptidase [Pirellulaceae bacterium]